MVSSLARAATYRSDATLALGCATPAASLAGAHDRRAEKNSLAAHMR
jgi:hypothetical protein